MTRALYSARHAQHTSDRHCVQNVQQSVLQCTIPGTNRCAIAGLRMSKKYKLQGSIRMHLYDILMT